MANVLKPQSVFTLINRGHDAFLIVKHNESNYYLIKTRIRPAFLFNSKAWSTSNYLYSNYECTVPKLKICNLCEDDTILLASDLTFLAFLSRVLLVF